MGLRKEGEGRMRRRRRRTRPVAKKSSEIIHEMEAQAVFECEESE